MEDERSMGILKSFGVDRGIVNDNNSLCRVIFTWNIQEDSILQVEIKEKETGRLLLREQTYKQTSLYYELFVWYSSR